MSYGCSLFCEFIVLAESWVPELQGREGIYFWAVLPKCLLRNSCTEQVAEVWEQPHSSLPPPPPPLFRLQFAKAPTSRGRIHFSRGLWVRKHVLWGVCKIHCSLLHRISKTILRVWSMFVGRGWTPHVLGIRCSAKGLSYLKKAAWGCRTVQ